LLSGLQIKKRRTNMKTNLLRASILAVVAAAAVYGQSTKTLKVTVPFDFVAGNRTLSAGQYSVAQGSVSGSVIINSADHKGCAIVLANAIQSAAAPNQGKLVFHRYGNTYFLAEVWGAGACGRQIPQTKRERELAVRRLPGDNTTLTASR
jgi:hypothetical protein